jgi:hypothetical protein
MDVVVILSVAILTYVILVYNRMQRLWQTVREGLANVDMEVDILADLTRRVADHPGDLPPLAARLAEVEQDLLLRRRRCNAAIATYNTYRSQIPQVILSRLAGFRPVEFPASRPACEDLPQRQTSNNSIWQLPAGEKRVQIVQRRKAHGVAGTVGGAAKVRQQEGVG